MNTVVRDKKVFEQDLCLSQDWKDLGGKESVWSLSAVEGTSICKNSETKYEWSIEAKNWSAEKGVKSWIMSLLHMLGSLLYPEHKDIIRIFQIV